MHMAQGGALNNDAFGNDVFGFPMKPDDFQDELTAIGAYTAVVFVLYVALAIVVPKSETSGQTEAKTSGQTKSETSGQTKSENSGQTKSETSGQNEAKTSGQTKSENSGQNKSETSGQTKSETSGQTEAKTDDRLSSMLLLLWLPLTPLLVYWANVESFENIYSSTMQQRLFGMSPEGGTFMRLYVAMQILGTIVECAQGAHDTFILAHHFSSVAAYVNILYCRRGSAYATVLGLSETTTIFLNLLLFSKHRRYKPWCDKHVPWLPTLSGVVLWLTWIPYRLVLFSCTTWWWARDMLSGDPTAAPISNFEAIFNPSVTALLWVLSIIWFRKIHRGMMKAVFGVASSKKVK